MDESLDEITESQAKASFWHDQIKQSSKHEEKFRKRGEKITDKYRGEESASSQRYALLWANTQLNIAALIGQIPQPDVARRWVTDDAIVRDAAEIQQKCMAHPMDEPAAVRSVRYAVMEGFLPGRGVIRCRYQAEFEEVETGRAEIIIDEFGRQLEQPVMVERDGALVPETEERKVREKAYLQRVYWQDYRESIGRSHEDVWWRAYRHYMTRDELKEEFPPDVAKKIPLTVSGSKSGQVVQSGDEDGTTEDGKLPAAFGRAELWEIWNKKDGTVIWIATGYGDIIKEEPPQLNLENFFDCADPLAPYTTTDNNIPIAEYSYYQDLALELDALQKRIAAIVSSLKVCGFTHAALKELGDLSAVKDGTFIPTSEEFMFALSDGSSPGMERLFASLPIERWANALPRLYERADSLKAQIYEITGFSDLMRGQTKASETLGAQNLKAQFGSYRLLPKQRAVQEWLEATYSIVGEIIAEMYDADTITKMTGIGAPKEFEEWIEENGGLPEAEDESQAMQIQRQAQVQYQQYVEADAAHFDEVMAFLRDNQMRSFRVNIELDELARPDRQAMQAVQAEAMAQSAQFMTALSNVPQPVVQPMLAAYRSYIRNFKLGREVEELFDEAIDDYPKFVEQSQATAAEAASQPPPEAQLKAQTDIELATIKANFEREREQMRIEAQLAIKAAEANQVAGAGMSEAEMTKIQADMDKARAKEEADTQRLAIKENAESERFRERMQMDFQIAEMRENAAMMRLCKQEETALNREIAKLDGMTAIEREKSDAAMQRERAKSLADLEKEALRASTTMACSLAKPHDAGGQSQPASEGQDEMQSVEGEVMPPAPEQPVARVEDILGMLREQRDQTKDIVVATHQLGLSLAEQMNRSGMSQEEIALRMKELEEQRALREQHRYEMIENERRHQENVDAQRDTAEAIKGQTEILSEAVQKKPAGLKVKRDEAGNVSEILPG